MLERNILEQSAEKMVVYSSAETSEISGCSNKTFLSDGEACHPPASSRDNARRYRMYTWR